MDGVAAGVVQRSELSHYIGMKIIAVVGTCLSNIFIQQGSGQSLGGVGISWGEAAGAPG